MNSKRKMWARDALLVSAVLIAAPSLPSAKCPLVTYQLRGVVLAGSGRAVPNARVNISWNGRQKQTLATLSDSAGRYEATVRFNPSEGEDAFGALCNASLNAFTIEAVAADGQTAIRLVNVEQLRTDVRLVVSLDPGAGRPGANVKRRARWMKW